MGTGTHIESASRRSGTVAKSDDGVRAAEQAEQPLPGVGLSSGRLLSLQRMAGNHAVTLLLSHSHIQRCGPVACDCSAAERAMAESAQVQRVPDEFQVRGKSPDAAADPRAIYFDYNSSVIDAAEDGKLSALAGTAVNTIRLLGYASEEHTRSQAGLVNARLHAVEHRLRAITPSTGVPTKTPRLDRGAGNIDYRSMRKVEVLIGGARSATLDCSHGADIDCGPAPNQFTTGHARAGALLTDALAALANPTVEPARTALTRFFGGPANAPQVIAALTAIQGHMANMVPAIPLNDRVAPGHRCINACEGDVFAYNNNTGAAARMTLGPQYMDEVNVVTRGLALIHEGSHGTSGLATTDVAYKWQRLLNFLDLAQALRNADSYTALVEYIQNPAMTTTPRTDTSVGLNPGQDTTARRSLAWLEQYLVQGRLDFRSLYSVVHQSRRAHHWTNTWYRDNTMTFASPLFGLTHPPAVPSEDSQFRIAGIFDRLYRLRSALIGQNIQFTLGAATTWAAGPGASVTLAAGFFALSPIDQVWALLTAIVAAAPYIDAGQRPAYVSVVQQMSARHGGP